MQSAIQIKMTDAMKDKLNPLVEEYIQKNQ